jgi:hypothetical protein
MCGEPPANFKGQTGTPDYSLPFVNASTARDKEKEERAALSRGNPLFFSQPNLKEAHRTVGL